MKQFVKPLLSATALAAVGAVFLAGSAGDRLARENCDSLRPGMPQAEVERRLGLPDRRLNIHRLGGAEEQACFYESLPVLDQEQSGAVTLLYVRESGLADGRWLLKEKLVSVNTHTIDVWVRLETLGKRVVSIFGNETPVTESVSAPDRTNPN